MHAFTRLPLALVLACAVAVSGLVAAPASGAAAESAMAGIEAVKCPTIRLKHWQSSSSEEKLAFLLGFCTMLELEKDWQAQKPLPISQSINQSWAKGLTGKTLGDLVDAVDRYAAANPEKGEKPVLVVLGQLFVRPAMSDQEREAARKRYEELGGRRR